MKAYAFSLFESVQSQLEDDGDLTLSVQIATTYLQLAHTKRAQFTSSFDFFRNSHALWWPNVPKKFLLNNHRDIKALTKKKALDLAVKGIPYSLKTVAYKLICFNDAHCSVNGLFNEHTNVLFDDFKITGGIDEILVKLKSHIGVLYTPHFESLRLVGRKLTILMLICLERLLGSNIPSLFGTIAYLLLFFVSSDMTLNLLVFLMNLSRAETPTKLLLPLEEDRMLKFTSSILPALSADFILWCNGRFDLLYFLLETIEFFGLNVFDNIHVAFLMLDMYMGHGLHAILVFLAATLNYITDAFLEGNGTLLSLKTLLSGLNYDDFSKILKLQKRIVISINDDDDMALYNTATLNTHSLTRNSNLNIPPELPLEFTEFLYELEALDAFPQRMYFRKSHVVFDSHVDGLSMQTFHSKIVSGKPAVFMCDTKDFWFAMLFSPYFHVSNTHFYGDSYSFVAIKNKETNEVTVSHPIRDRCKLFCSDNVISAGADEGHAVCYFNTLKWVTLEVSTAYQPNIVDRSIKVRVLHSFVASFM
ncbi:hypothetical protein PCE1_004768 [Barthelona sp. PCE]